MPNLLTLVGHRPSTYAATPSIRRDAACMAHCGKLPIKYQSICAEEKYERG
jgi:hypothetical protein